MKCNLQQLATCASNGMSVCVCVCVRLRACVRKDGKLIEI